MDNEDLQERVDGLVKFLSTRKDLPEYNIKTVMEMTRRLAKYEHDLNAERAKNREVEAMLSDNRISSGSRYDPLRLRHDEPNILQLPLNTRSVEIKL